MARAALLLPLLLAAPLVGAAPVPAERAAAAKLRHLWGETTGPAGCGFALRGDRLVVSTPDRPAWGNLTTAETEVPRTRQAVTGDFDIRVRVHQLTPPKRDVWFTGYDFNTVAGVYVASADTSVQYGWAQQFAVDRAQNQPPRVSDRFQSGVWHRQVFQNGASWGMSGGAKPETGPVDLRLTRKDGKLTASTAVGGAAARPTDVHISNNGRLPDAIEVGVFLGHTPWHACTAEFERLPADKP